MTWLDTTNPFAPAERIWWWSAALFLAVFLLFLIVQRFDARLIDGESVWAKPLKFAIATAVHYATCAAVLRGLSPAIRSADLMTWTAIISVAAAAFEVIYIAIQGARALPSHFNTSSPFYAALYSAMAIAAIIVLAPISVLGTAAAVDGSAGWPVAVRVGVAVGMIGATILTLITAFRIGANMSHFIGALPADSASVPLLGWSLYGADLRPAHFLALHMAQAVPLAAVIASALLPDPVATAVTATFAGLWCAATLAVYGNAVGGRSITQLLGG